MDRLLLLGATGLVGRQVLSAALADQAIGGIVAPTRRPLPPHPKLENPTIDFDALDQAAPWWKADALICTLGTTRKLAGSKEAFRHVDHDLVLAAARLARQAGTPVFALNSGLGANPRSSSFYLKVKGETERDLAALGFSALIIVRPSLLDGRFSADRRPDARPAEDALLVLDGIVRPLLPKRWRAVRTDKVARHLLLACRSPRPGVTILESEDLQD